MTSFILIAVPCSPPSSGSSSCSDDSLSHNQHSSGGVITVNNLSVVNEQVAGSYPVQWRQPAARRPPSGYVNNNPTQYIRIDTERKPQYLEDAISMYIDYLIFENESKTGISQVTIVPMPCHFDRERYYYEALEHSCPFPTEKFRRWIKLYGLDIEVGEAEPRSAPPLPTSPSLPPIQTVHLPQKALSPYFASLLKLNQLADLTDEEALTENCTSSPSSYRTFSFVNSPCAAPRFGIKRPATERVKPVGGKQHAFQNQ